VFWIGSRGASSPLPPQPLTTSGVDSHQLAGVKYTTGCLFQRKCRFVLPPPALLAPAGYLHRTISGGLWDLSRMYLCLSWTGLRYRSTRRAPLSTTVYPLLDTLISLSSLHVHTGTKYRFLKHARKKGNGGGPPVRSVCHIYGLIASLPG